MDGRGVILDENYLHIKKNHNIKQNCKVLIQDAGAVD